MSARRPRPEPRQNRERTLLARNALESDPHRQPQRFQVPPFVKEDLEVGTEPDEQPGPRGYIHSAARYRAKGRVRLTLEGVVPDAAESMQERLRFSPADLEARSPMGSRRSSASLK